ncbi:hypothetical protein ACFV8T_14680 [Streptomyces sp. NPDC059832]|uniref:hypothetical protein n=1 Tax=unclassified Streptomyces TaxID=2593676 RepID=UPI003658AD1B
MPFAPLGRHNGEHSDYCNTSLCCRCQQRNWTTQQGNERLCGLCAACCRECGRAPAPHLDGLSDGICVDCRGLCTRCHNPLSDGGVCHCQQWKQSPGGDPIRFIMQGFPQPLLQALGHRVPRTLPDILFEELERRTAAQLLDRIERRWSNRWSHAIHERDEENRRRWAPQEIAEALVSPGACSNRACEDGYLLADGAPCPYCQRPAHRFVPATADAISTSEHARATAAQIRQALIGNRSAGKKPNRGAQPGAWPTPPAG